MAPRVRKSLQQVYAEYLDNTDRATLQNLIRAFRGIQQHDFLNEDSFYVLAGWHGEPFRGPARGFKAASWWWGGYCNHGNVLFPTWHRAYLLRLEDALRRVDDRCKDVTLPFWDECFEMNSKQDPTKPARVIPDILTQPKFTYDDEPDEFDNPLYSYTLARDTSFTQNTPWDPDAAKTNNTRYSKPKGYKTVRFPLSGLVGTDEDKDATHKWNAQFTGGPEQLRDILNGNVANWLIGNIHPSKDPKGGDPNKPPRLPDTFAVYELYKKCLEAPNYTVFTNTTSASQWIADSTSPEDRHLVVPLEAPHNSIHLSVGGFYQKGNYNANVPEYQSANGDMGDNETAGFDPIFYFHHCFVDYVLWTYQRKHKLTTQGSLSVIYDYAGTITDDIGGSPVGLPPGTLLDMTTPLAPFRHPSEPRYLTSHDVTDITNLPDPSTSYTYGAGSLDPYIAPKSSFDSLPSGIDTTTSPIASWKRVRGINRAAIEGSFVIRTYAVSPDGQTEIEIGREAVLSRLNVKGCKNCQTHVEAVSQVPLYQEVVDRLLDSGDPAAGNGDLDFAVRIQTHAGVQEKVPMGLGDGVKSSRPVVEDF